MALAPDYWYFFRFTFLQQSYPIIVSPDDRQQTVFYLYWIIIIHVSTVIWWILSIHSEHTNIIICAWMRKMRRRKKMLQNPFWLRIVTRNVSQNNTPRYTSLTASNMKNQRQRCFILSNEEIVETQLSLFWFSSFSFENFVVVVGILRTSSKMGYVMLSVHLYCTWSANQPYEMKMDQTVGYCLQQETRSLGWNNGKFRKKAGKGQNGVYTIHCTGHTMEKMK